MRLNAPKKMTWTVAVILGAVGLLGYFVPLSFLTLYAFWFVFAGFALLALGSFLKGF